MPYKPFNQHTTVHKRHVGRFDIIINQVGSCPKPLRHQPKKVRASVKRRFAVSINRCHLKSRAFYRSVTSSFVFLGIRPHVTGDNLIS
ncbi:hypothetical protein G7K_0476-t1 [Saitoella complicata NRRL Y-17804]|uniref:Uncharacterized protein n=1 Tax=Saitoella complicata (strain BCRC 22490 / CBS 7301 / JCM 7358 / NBRC 10748 / NRRL Y-17804) TaxID=698492 RepID=A0A0E9N947_SAICN|nr:hypothetical protein G7K_0476-t1 [Saitoella complicata NRRL Y-17804]